VPQFLDHEKVGIELIQHGTQMDLVRSVDEQVGRHQSDWRLHRAEHPNCRSALSNLSYHRVGKSPEKFLGSLDLYAEAIWEMAAATDTKVTLVRETGTRVVSVAGRLPVGELTANCEHGHEADRGEFVVGSSNRAITWRVLFCDVCWEHFRHHQDVIDLTLFEDAVEDDGTS
jgi:hypothetical protein